VGILQNLKVRRRQKVVLRATKNPLRPRNKLSHAPDAVSREYRGKIATRKGIFAHHLSFRTKWRNLSLECKITQGSHTESTLEFFSRLRILQRGQQRSDPGLFLGSVTNFLVRTVERFFLAADAKPNVLMNWIVAHNVIWPDIVSLGDVSVLVVQREVISMDRRRRRTNWAGCWRIGRTSY
jgi:hypothetical protein